MNTVFTPEELAYHQFSYALEDNILQAWNILQETEIDQETKEHIALDKLRFYLEIVQSGLREFDIEIKHEDIAFPFKGKIYCNSLGSQIDIRGFINSRKSGYSSYTIETYKGDRGEIPSRELILHRGIDIYPPLYINQAVTLAFQIASNQI